MALDDAADRLGDLVGRHTGQVEGRVDHVQGPHHYEHQQRNGRLVDFGNALEGDKQVAYAECYYYNGSQTHWNRKIIGYL